MPTATTADLRTIYERTGSIVVVGCSSSTDKAAHRIPRYLQEQGYRVVCVNPTADEILGAPTYRGLAEVQGPIDLVDVFRPAEEAPAIARAAVAAGARTLWLQEGIVSAEARRVAEEAGVAYVEDRCIAKVHGELGLGPGPG